jgi:hypothetical protein
MLKILPDANWLLEMELFSNIHWSEHFNDLIIKIKGLFFKAATKALLTTERDDSVSPDLE